MRIDCCVSYFQKQLIGLLPSGTECMYYYAPDSDVYFWTINGVAANDPLAVNAAISGYGYHYEAFLDPGFVQKFVLSYVGTEPPTYLPTILDGNGDPVTWTLTNCCNKVCLEGTFNSNDYYYLITGYGWTAALGEYVSNFTVGQMEQYIQGLYGTQTLYTATDNGDGTWYVKIDNAYVCNPPLAWSANDATYTDMVPCGTPVCYYRVSVADFNGTCFTAPGWDFNGQGVDFNAVANSFGGYYVQDGYPGASINDTCDQVTFYYIGYAPPANLIVYDPSSGLLDWPFYNAGCYFGCVTWEPIKLDQVYDSILFNGTLSTTTAAYGGTLDFVNDLIGAENMLNAIFTKYFPGSTVNVTESLGFITITFNNVWYDPAYLVSGANSLTYNGYTSFQYLTASEC